MNEFVKGGNGNILLVANYSNDVGYAWDNIYELYEAVASHFQDIDCQVFVSFSSISYPVSQVKLRVDENYFQWDPFDTSFVNTFKLIRFIKQRRIKHVYLTDFKYIDIRYCLFRLAGIRTILIHNRISVASPYPAVVDKGWRKFLKFVLSRSYFLCATKVYAVSEFVRHRLISKNMVPEQSVVKILNGIDIDRFTPSERVNNDKLVIFVSGRATLHKGIHVLARAVGRLPSELLSKVEIRYAGDGPDMDEIKRIVSEFKIATNFIFLGKLSSVLVELKSSDIVVVPSIWGDACPSSISEALASAKPLIATRAGGIPEMVGGDMNALLIEPNNEEEMLEALIRLITNDALRAKLALNARKRAELCFSKYAYHEKVLGQIESDLVSD